MHVIIIGAGIVGLASAHQLLDRGHTVTLIDRGELTAASRGNAGIIAHVDIQPLATPGMILKAARWFVDPVGPLAIRPAYIPRLAPWLLRFLFASRPSQIERSMTGIIPLQLHALPAWERLLARLGLQREFNRNGMLYVFESIETFEANKANYQKQVELGIPLELIDGSVIRALEPALSDRFQRAAFYPSVAHVNDPYHLALKLADIAAQRGAELKEGTVSGIAITSGDEPVVILEGGRTLSADRVLVAAGAWSRSLAACLGDKVPLDTERGYNATITHPGISLTRPIMFEEHAFVLTPLKTGLRIGGAVELASTSASPNWNRVEALLAKAHAFVPDLREDGRVDYMGCRPSLPDSLPVISTSRWSRKVVYAFGHAHHGLTQAAVTAELVGSLISGEEPMIDLAPYSAQRF
ncbi:MAG: amino acid oxidase [Proteobacteria bacterium]|jgi:D-amino-acid dehydrogenase|nr:MAG: amino acid oxidase [Pseudomonadota bacterium]